MFLCHIQSLFLHFVSFVPPNLQNTPPFCSPVLITASKLRTQSVEGSGAWVCPQRTVFLFLIRPWTGHVRCEECGLNMLMIRFFVFLLDKQLTGISTEPETELELSMELFCFREIYFKPVSLRIMFQEKQMPSSSSPSSSHYHHHNHHNLHHYHHHLHHHHHHHDHLHHYSFLNPILCSRCPTDQ